MTKQIVFAPDAVPPLPVFSQAVTVNGIVYVSGNIGCTNDYKIVEGGVEAQARAAMDNVAKVLKAAGSSMDHVIKMNLFLTNVARDFSAVNKIYSEYFNENPPTRTCIGVAALPLGAEFEVECIAEVAK